MAIGSSLPNATEQTARQILDNRRQGFRVIALHGPDSRHEAFDPKEIEQANKWIDHLESSWHQGSLTRLLRPGHIEQEDFALARRIVGSCELLGKVSEVKPTIYQLCALLYRTYQSDPQAEKLFSRSILLLRSVLIAGRSRYQDAQPIWIGELWNVDGLVLNSQIKQRGQSQRSLTKEVCEVFKKNDGKILTLYEISSSLSQTEGAEDVTQHLYGVLQFLQSLGEVQRHPDLQDPEIRKPISAWGLRNAATLKPENRNPIFQVLQYVADGGHLMTDIYYKKGCPEQGKFASKSIVLAVQCLERLEFLDVTLAKHGIGSARAAASTNRQGCALFLNLTDRAKNVVLPWAQTAVGQALPQAEYEIIRRCIVDKLPLSDLI